MDCIFDRLALSLPADKLEDDSILGLAARYAEDPDILALAAKAPGPCSLAGDPAHPKHNWVTDTGGLPDYICQIAKAVKRSGHDTGSAIAIAVGTVKRWAVDPRKSASVRTRAAQAVEEWERKRAEAHAEHGAKAAGGS